MLLAVAAQLAVTALADGPVTVCSALPRDAAGRSTANRRTCLLCEHVAAAGPLLPNVDYIASGSCDGVATGELRLAGPLVVPRSTSVRGSGVSVTGDVVVDGENAALSGLKLYGSVNITDGRGLNISDLTLVATGTAASPAIRGYKAAMDGASISNVDVVGSTAQQRVPVALLACTGAVEVTCANSDYDRVMVQQAQSLHLTTTSCAGAVIDLDDLIGSFGRAYEAEYLNEFMSAKPGATPTLRTVVFYAGYITAALALYTVASGPAKVKVD